MTLKGQVIEILNAITDRNIVRSFYLRDKIDGGLIFQNNLTSKWPLKLFSYLIQSSPTNNRGEIL